MRRIAAILAIVAAACTCRAAEGPRVVHSLKEVRALSHADAAQHLPVDVVATVTFFRGYEGTLFVQDGDAGGFVYATTKLRLEPGDVIRIRGTTDDSFNPIMVSSDLTVVGHGQLPAPAPARWADLESAKYDCRWVTVQGRVVVAEIGRTSGVEVTHLVLSLDGGIADIIVDGNDRSSLSGLLDARVEVQAVAGEIFDGKMEQTGVRLHVPSLDYVKVLERMPVDGWNLPITPIDQVMRGYSMVEKTPRVRVAGVLTFYRQKYMGIIQDGMKSIRVDTSQIDRLTVGDRVEAIGIPAVEDNLLTLKLGSIRRIGAAAPLAPLQLTYDDLAGGKHPFDLVSMEGTVVSQVRQQSQDLWVIAAGGHLFSATLVRAFSYSWPLPKVLPPMREIRPGSRVRVTGVAALETGNPYNGPVGFNILLRSEDDLAVLAPASWLTVRNLLGVVSALSLILLGITIWVAMLRRKVHGKTAELAKRIEAEATLERRRSKILEDINGARPLVEILEQVVELVSSSLNGGDCWIRVADAAPIGKVAQEEAGRRILRQEIRSRAGSLHGTIYAALREPALSDEEALQALSMGAWLATLAIETRSLYSDLVHRSDFDLLTDVHNRFSLERQLNRMVAKAHARRECFGLIYIDLDEFKQVNDRYGHHIGDLYLQDITERMKRQLRPGDMLARLGGDEFAVLVPEVRSRAVLEEIADRLEHCFDEPFSLEAYTLRGSGSVGMAVFPEDGTSRDALLGAADATMYEAKRKRQKMLEELRIVGQ
jgi:diguanylate cyclase (GGDEF)-like protein